MFCSGGRHRNQCRPSRGGFFILQLHDELIYEVAEEDVIQVIRKTSLITFTLDYKKSSVVISLIVLFLQVAQIMKREMESVVKLYVKLLVKVKVGPSWGKLQDLDI